MYIKVNYKSPNYILSIDSFHFKINGVTIPSNFHCFHSIQVMTVILSHVSLDWHEMGKVDCKVESHKEENMDEKESKRLSSTLSTSTLILCPTFFV